MLPSINHLPKVQRALLAWHAGRGLLAPWRHSGDPYECLVAAVMAQQTQMSRVLPSYERFIAAFPTLGSLATASAGAVIRVWSGMGYNTRAVRLHHAAQAIHASGWPRDAASLEMIDGIGPFTAAIIASFAFGAPAACVDTNVRRVLGRLSGEETIDGKRLQQLADASIAGDAPARWNQALMDYGATVCGVRPKCGECVVGGWCASRERFSAPRVVEERAPYVTKARTTRSQPKFEGSPRWYRGRIVALLRELPPGVRLPLADLPTRVADAHGSPSLEDLRALAAGLERDGLAVVAGGAISLPD